MSTASPPSHTPPLADDPPLAPPRASELEGADNEAADLDDVIAREIQYIRFHRHGDRKYADVRRTLVGLALSGGGIRSATTNLGILQALANMEILPMVDYLCTVSGGGYIGTCLSTLLSLNALYLAVAGFLMPDVIRLNVGGGGAIAPFDTTRPTLVVGDSTRVRTRTVQCAPLDPQCSEQVSVPLSRPSGTTWLRYHLSRATADLVSTWNRIWRGELKPTPSSHPAFAAFYAGLGLSIFACVWMVAALVGYRRHWSFFARRPDAGESQEDSFDRGFLRSLAWVAFLVLVAAIVVLRSRWPNWNARDPLKQFVWLLAPLIVLIGARVGSFVITLLLPQILSGRWSRRVRSLWGGYQAITIYGTWITLTFALLVPLMYAFADARGQLALGAVASLVVSRLLAKRTSGGESKLKLPAGLLHFVLALAVLATIAFGVVLFGAELVRRHSTDTDLWWVAGIVTLIVAVMSFVVDQNKLSPHYFYRDRIAETNLLSEIPDTARRQGVNRDAMERPLQKLHGELVEAPHASNETRQPKLWCNPAPYHLISAAINLAGSKDLTRKDRKSGYWLFSKLFCGSVHTGFRPTAIYRRGETKVARAAATSGAAAASAMGFMTFFAQSFATVLF